MKVKNCINLLVIPTEKVVVKSNTECQTLGQFISAHFPDLNPNSYDINNMKFDLMPLPRSNLNDQCLKPE